MLEIEVIVHGRVVGVMFRDFVKRQARRLGITGTVENQTNRTVRVVAQGQEKTLREFISYLEQGSLFSKVENVEVAWREPLAALSDFRIVIVY